jgi:hypothetical protein
MTRSARDVSVKCSERAPYNSFVRFKKSFAASGITLGDETDPIALNMQREHALSVVLTSLDSAGQGIDHLRCDIETTFPPTEAVTAAFTDLARGRLPMGHRPRNEWTRDHSNEVDSGGNVLGNWVLPRYLMPESLRVFADKLDEEMHGVATDAVDVLRWRSRTLGARHPLSSTFIEWTLDGETWHPMPASTSVTFGDVSRLDVTASTAAQLQELLDTSQLEPLAHALFREAWSQRQANPSSSFLIGMAALEIGVKHHIAACVPAATWLAEHVPSPPIVAILVDYLPTLDPPDGGSPMAQLDRDGDLIKTLKVAVTKRNELAHRGVEMSHNRLRKTLRAIRNVLWMLDVARGHVWAADYLSPLDGDPPVGYRRV